MVQLLLLLVFLLLLRLFWQYNSPCLVVVIISASTLASSFFVVVFFVVVFLVAGFFSVTTSSSFVAALLKIENEFNLTYSQTGLVTTFFFFAYGIGQVVNGILCKKYNIKYVIFISLLSSSILNLLLVKKIDEIFGDRYFFITSKYLQDGNYELFGPVYNEYNDKNAVYSDIYYYMNNIKKKKK